MIITVIEPHAYLLTDLTDLQLHIERCGRICYKSEERITDGSAEKFVSKICRNRHESVLEHASATAVVVCSRSASHQLVRHRIAAYSQESQRYVNYTKKGYEVVAPPSVLVAPGQYELADTMDGHAIVAGPLFETPRGHSWMKQMGRAFQEYDDELASGVRPEDARYVLPNACKTELAVTFNMRVWRHVFRERALNDHAQWEIRGIMRGLYAEMTAKLPSVFGDLE
jgi:thymidylate synthase (FAD)